MREKKEDRFIKGVEVRELLGGISASSLWRLVQDGTVPKPIKLGGRITVYKKSWIDKLLALESGTDMRA